jgi:phosphotriesterase-related protein
MVGPTIMHEHIFIDLNDPTVDPERWRWADTVPPAGTTAVDIYYRPLTMDILPLVLSGYRNKDNAYLTDEVVAIQELNEYKRRGGRTVVDVTSIGLRRDPLALKRVAEATGLQVVMGASWYRKTFHPPDMDTRTVESLTDGIVRDITVGADGTDIRSGIIGEVGTIGDPLTPNEIKVIRASGRASRLTGAPVSVHTHAWLHEQPRILDLFESEGTDLTRVIIGHSNPIADDVPFMKQILDRGAYIQFDTLGRASNAIGASGNVSFFRKNDDPAVAKGVVELIKAGYGDQILLSQDVCLKQHLKKYRGTGYSYILEQFVPHLKQLGVTDAQIQAIMVENPKRVLTFAAPGSERPSE